MCVCVCVCVRVRACTCSEEGRIIHAEVKVTNKYACFHVFSAP